MHKSVAFLLLIVAVGGEFGVDHNLPGTPTDNGNAAATPNNIPKDETDSEELGNDIASVVKKFQAVKDTDVGEESRNQIEEQATASANQNAQAEVKDENQTHDKIENVKEITAAFIDAERKLANNLKSASEVSPTNEVHSVNEKPISNDASTDTSKSASTGNELNPSSDATLGNKIQNEKSSPSEATQQNDANPSKEVTVGNEESSSKEVILKNEESSSKEVILKNEESPSKEVILKSEESPSKEVIVGNEEYCSKGENLNTEENHSEVSFGKTNTESLSEGTSTSTDSASGAAAGDERQHVNEDDTEQNTEQKTETEKEKEVMEKEEKEEEIVESSEESKSLKSKISENDDTGRKGEVMDISMKCLDCLCYFATDCDMKRNCVTTKEIFPSNDGFSKGDCGPFHISFPFWADATNTKLDLGDAEMENEWRTCSLDLKCATTVIKKYFQKYPHDCNGDGKVDCLDYAAIHTLGPFGCLSKSNLLLWNGYRRKGLLKCMVSEEEGEYTKEMRKLEMQESAPMKLPADIWLRFPSAEDLEKLDIQRKLSQKKEKAEDRPEDKTENRTEDKTEADIVVDVDVDLNVVQMK